MSGNGTQRKHGKTVGYIVTSDLPFEAGTACHGYTDSGLTVLLGGDYATLYASRRAAQRAIDQSKAQRPGTYHIHRVAPLAE